MSIMGKTQGAAVRMYQLTYIMGFCLGSVLFLVVNRIFPPPGLGIAEEFDHDSNIIEGVDASVGEEEKTAKSPIATETKILDKPT
jgi:nucleobase:cation symporter-1, NCS1 family